MNLLFVLSGNLSTTPRALKLIEYFAKKGYNIDIVAINRMKAWLNIDKQILPNGVNYVAIDICRNNILKWLVATIVHYLAKVLWFLYRQNTTLAAFSSSKATIFLWLQTLKLPNKYTKIFGHSYGSMFITYLLAKRLKTPFIFDVEDYHPGEHTTDSNEKQRRELLMLNILPQADYLTYASPLIGKYTLELIGGLPSSKHALIDNCFASKEFEFVDNQSSKVRFVWFSQNIGARRGLELVLPALANFVDKIELHLVGNVQKDFYDNFLKQYIHFVTIHKPMSQQQLHKFVCNFDIGLAIEVSYADINKQIALSNKIFAYAQAGLYILATDTPAQKLFMKENNCLGHVVEQNTESFVKEINYLLANIDTIRAEKHNRFEYAKKFDYYSTMEKLNEFFNVDKKPIDNL